MMKRKLLTKAVSLILTVCLGIQASGFTAFGQGTGSGSDELAVPDNGFVPGYIDIGYTAPVIGTENGADGLPLLKADNLESSYSSRDLGYTTAIKSQGSLGVCWAFAAVACMETYALKNGLVSGTDAIDLSEYALASLTFDDTTYKDTTGTTTLDGLKDYTSTTDIYKNLTTGGNDNYIFKTMSKWAGIMSEEDALFNYSGDTKVTYDASKIKYILTGQKFINMADEELVKRTIKQYGAVSASYCANDEYDSSWNKLYHYTYEDTYTNHAVAIVGWDDTISKDNFSITVGDETYTPSRDGAWLIKNSWGTYWGDNGYTWISYDDMSIKKVNACAYEIAPKDKYTYNYQHDGNTVFGYTTYIPGISTYANVFEVTSENEQDIKAVSFSVEDANRAYSIQIYSNPKTDAPDSGTPLLSEPVKGTTTFAGYYTVTLPKVLKVTKGDTFSIVISFDESTVVSASKKGTVPIGGGGVANMTGACGDNQSYVLYGDSFRDMYELSVGSETLGINFCIKAFGVDNKLGLAASAITDITQQGLDKLSVKWQAVEGAAKYELYRATDVNGRFTKVYEGTDTSYEDKDVTLGGQYYYMVKTLDDTDEMTSEVKDAKLVIESTSLSGQSYDSEGITIKWSAIDYATGYNVYRSEDGVKYTKIASVDKNTTSYKDGTPKYNVKYYYVVRVLADADGVLKESDKSNSLSVTKKVAKPSEVKADASEYGKTKLSWKIDGKVDGIKIYRTFTYTTNTTISMQEIANLSGDVTSYEADTTDLECGLVVRYHICAYVEEDLETKFSDKVEVRANVKYKQISGIKWYMDNSRLYVTWDAYSATGVTPSGYVVTLYKYNTENGGLGDYVNSRNPGATETSAYFWNSLLDMSDNYYIVIEVKNAMHVSVADAKSDPIKIGGTFTQFKVNDIADVSCKRDDSVKLTAVMADELPNFDYKYQWYETTLGDTDCEQGTAIKGATDSSYKPDTSKGGDRYYYCMVTGMYKTQYLAVSNLVKVGVEREPQKNGLVCEDGVWKYYKDGSIDTEYSGAVINDLGMWYVANGTIDWSYTGLAKYGELTCYIKDGAVNSSYTGLINVPDEWVYITDGVVNTYYCGLVNNEYGWWYVANGTVDWTYTNLVQADGVWWYVRNGGIDFGYMGLYENEYGWWYIKDGKVAEEYCGLVNNENGWWYVSYGRIDWEFTGLIENEYGWWYVRNGGIDFTYTGLVENEYGWWYVVNSGIDFNYTGPATNDYGTWNVVNGKVVF